MKGTNSKVSRKIRTLLRDSGKNGYVVRLPTKFIERTSSRHAIVEEMDKNTVLIRLIE